MYQVGISKGMCVSSWSLAKVKIVDNTRFELVDIGQSGLDDSKAVVMLWK